jgi:hypothetical protein
MRNVENGEVSMHCNVVTIDHRLQRVYRFEPNGEKATGDENMLWNYTA